MTFLRASLPVFSYSERDTHILRLYFRLFNHADFSISFINEALARQAMLKTLRYGLGLWMVFHGKVLPSAMHLRLQLSSFVLCCEPFKEEKKTLGCPGLPVQGNRSGLAAQMVAMAFTAFARAVGVRFVAQLTVPNLWFKEELGCSNMFAPVQMEICKFHSSFLLRPLWNLPMMDWLWTPLVGLFLRWTMRPLVFWPIYVFPIWTGSYPWRVCIVHTWTAGKPSRCTKSNNRPF